MRQGGRSGAGEKKNDGKGTHNGVFQVQVFYGVSDLLSSG